MTIGLLNFTLAYFFSFATFPKVNKHFDVFFLKTNQSYSYSLKYGRDKNFADPKASIVANFGFLRNIVSLASILCCLSIGLSVNWNPKATNEDFISTFNESFNSNLTRLVSDCNDSLESCHNTTSCTYFELHFLMFYIAILSCSSFIQLYFYFKLFMMFLVICVYILSFNMQMVYECLNRSSIITDLSIKTELILNMLFFIIFLHLIDRRVRLLI